MDMANPMLKRSGISFRRQGSSGLAWCENWIPAEMDGKAPTGHRHIISAPSPKDETGDGSSNDRPESPSVRDSLPSSSAHDLDSLSARLRHSKSVGFIGAGYSRSRDHRVGSSDAYHHDDHEGGTPLSDNKRHRHHKSQSRIVKWIKKTFGMGKK